MNSINWKSIVIAFLIIILTSCDFPLFVHYTVTNSSHDSIRLDFTYQWETWRGVSTSDTSIVIPPNKTDTIYTYRSIGPSVYNPEFGNDTLKNIYDFSITRFTDSTAIENDIYLIKNWTVKQTKNNILVFNYKF
jgi:hypothetical protein